jgi:hypothetical protein
MKKLMLVPLVALAMAFAVNIPVAAAQENNNEDKFSFGKVLSVNAQEVMVKEYDFAKDADVEVPYSITAETELGNVNAVADLAVNDDIVIDYVEKDGKRIVTTLVKEDKGAEAPVAPAEAAPAAGTATAPAVAAPAPAPVAAEVPAAVPAVNTVAAPEAAAQK